MTDTTTLPRIPARRHYFRVNVALLVEAEGYDCATDTVGEILREHCAGFAAAGEDTSLVTWDLSPAGTTRVAFDPNDYPEGTYDVPVSRLSEVTP